MHWPAVSHVNPWIYKSLAREICRWWCESLIFHLNQLQSFSISGNRCWCWIWIWERHVWASARHILAARSAENYRFKLKHMCKGYTWITNNNANVRPTVAEFQWPSQKTNNTISNIQFTIISLCTYYIRNKCSHTGWMNEWKGRIMATITAS